jgi:hypothetical protein
MKNYTQQRFIEIVKNADIIYGEVSLNASVRIPARVRKKSLLEKLEKVLPEKAALGFYGSSSKDKKGRRILKVL